MEQPLTEIPVSIRARHLHEELTSSTATGVADAPGSFPVIGEQSDYAGGVAIYGLSSQRLAVALSPRSDEEVVVRLRNDASDSSTKDSISLSEIACRAEAQQPSTDSQGKPIIPPAPEGGLAARLGGVMWTLAHQQLLRENTGLDITVVSDIPEGLGLGEFTALDLAAQLAIMGPIDEHDDARVRRRLADAASNAEAMFSDIPGFRGRHHAVMRTLDKNALAVMDYSDLSLTNTPAPIGPDQSFSLLAVGVPQAPATSAVEHLRATRLFIDQACHAFGVKTLHALPDFPFRVLPWLQAVHQVRGPEDVPTIDEAQRILHYLERDSTRARAATRALRSRQSEQLAQILNDSQADAAISVGTDVSSALVELLLGRRASAARALAPGITQSALVLVPKGEESEVHGGLVDAHLSVVKLAPGARAEARMSGP